MGENSVTGHTRRQFLALGGGFASAALVSACGAGSGGQGGTGGSGGGPRRGGVVTFASPDPVNEHLDMHKSQDPATARFITPMYSKLLEFEHGPDQTGLEVVPDLARDWEISGDGLTYTFHLRKNVVWHDMPPVNGRKFTSDDVLATFDRVRKLPADHAWQFEAVADITAPDEHTVVIELDKPYAPFLTYLAHPWNVIYPREGVEGKYDLEAKVIGTGPFMLDAWERDEQMVRVRNPEYFLKGRPYLDELHSVVIQEPSATAAALRSGRITVGGFKDPGQTSDLSSTPDLKSLKVLGGPVTLNLQLDKEPFTDLRVRRAVAMAIDFERLGKSVRGDYVLSSTVPPVSGEFALPPEEIKKVRPYDPERARQLLAEAGHPSGFSTEMVVQELSPEDIRGAEFMVQDLKKIGIDVKLQVHDPATAFERRLNGQFEMAKAQRGIVMADAYLSDYEPGARLNYSNMDDSKLGEMIKESRTILDHNERVAHFHDIQRYMETEIAGAIYGPQTYNYHVYQAALHNFHPHQMITGRFWADVWLDQ